MYIQLAIVLFSLINIIQMEEPDITKGPPPYDKPWVSAWGWFGETDPKGWKERHDKMLNQTHKHKKDIQIVFYGDSKSEYWIREGKKVWEKYYVDRDGYNYGIGGDSTRQVLWRIQHKELDGLTPKILVFMIGGNNFHENYNRGTDDEIVKAEHLIVEQLHEKLPKTQIIFVSQLPRGKNDDRARDINNMWDEYLKHHKNPLFHFVNPYTKYNNSDGTQNLNLYIGDHIHLNEKGYTILAETLEPLIKKYL
ncbi:platelet-activating factor acetylhydrolase IB subunit alpha1-like [Oppia nitens]|uniref:platelet-activating factor acetylhydrolase IB subunit alpha1-like n=1 Tax=Oppia nitens TaxID=1686743 RepID=UPI0023DBE4CE|nr:platelet-activating factor acetylhydrolase IB subunit alpha1-like [Oppia nitens]